GQTSRTRDPGAVNRAVDSGRRSPRSLAPHTCTNPRERLPAVSKTTRTAYFLVPPIRPVRQSSGNLTRPKIHVLPRPDRADRSRLGSIRFFGCPRQALMNRYAHEPLRLGSGKWRQGGQGFHLRLNAQPRRRLLELLWTRHEAALYTLRSSLK